MSNSQTVPEGLHVLTQSPPENSASSWPIPELPPEVYADVIEWLYGGITKNGILPVQ